MSYILGLPGSFLSALSGKIEVQDVCQPFALVVARDIALLGEEHTSEVTIIELITVCLCVCLRAACLNS